MTSESQLIEEIREVVAEIGEIDDPQEITLQSHFMDELDLDSMMLLEILSTLERQYEISIPEEEFPNMVTLSMCAETVKKLACH